MIKHIAFTGDYSHLPNNIRHSENVALHEKFKDGIEFCNGVNIIIGNSGTGKSTVLEHITRQLACHQGGIVKRTRAWEREYTDYFSGAKQKFKPDTSIDITHDGSLTYYYNPSYITGLYHGQFDDDFFSEGMINLKTENSTGIYNAIRFTRLLDKIKDDEKELQKMVDADFYVPAKLPKTKPTLIIDEFERGMSLSMQLKMLHNLILKNYRRSFQLIIVTHSPAILSIVGDSDVNVIEFSDGYLDELKSTIGLLQNKGDV